MHEWPTQGLPTVMRRQCAMEVIRPTMPPPQLYIYSWFSIYRRRRPQGYKLLAPNQWSTNGVLTQMLPWLSQRCTRLRSGAPVQCKVWSGWGWGFFEISRPRIHTPLLYAFKILKSLTGWLENIAFHTRIYVKGVLTRVLTHLVLVHFVQGFMCKVGTNAVLTWVLTH